MSMEYTKSEIIKMIDLIFRSGKLGELYKQNFINYVGNTSDTNDAFMEVISEYLLQRLDNFNSYFSHIEETVRSSYRTMSHDKQWPDFDVKTPKADECRSEKIAKCMFIESDWDDEIGKLLDYQIPLRNTLSDEKLDLASFNEKQNIIRVIQVESELSENTFIQCLLKAYTYSKILDFSKLQSDFKIKSNPKLGIAIVVSKESPLVGQVDLPLIKEFISALDIPVELYTWDYDEKGTRKFVIQKN